MSVVGVSSKDKMSVVGVSLKDKMSVIIKSHELYEVISSKTLHDIENYLNKKNFDINTIVDGTFCYNYVTHNYPEKTLLEIAVKRANLNIINYLLKNGADINKSGKHNRTSLSRAVEEDNLEVVKLCITKGADVNLINRIDGNTPLAMAVRYRKTEIAKYLINVGANIWKVGKNGKTPLLWGVENNDLKIITELLDYSAEVKHAVHTAFMRAIELQRFEIFQLLRKRGALINIIHKNGYTPLTKAIELCNFEIVKELVDNGADVNMLDRQKNSFATLLFEEETATNGEYPLLLSFVMGNTKIIQFLIDNGADVNITDSDGNSPLMHAVKIRNFEIMKSIIDAGANVNIISKSGCTPLFLAIQKENFQMVKYLVERGAGVTGLSDQKSLLICAAENYNISIFQLLIDSGVDLYSVIDEIEEIASGNEDFLIYFNSLEKKKKVSDITLK